jgi:hypothetical protein
MSALRYRPFGPDRLEKSAAATSGVAFFFLFPSLVSLCRSGRPRIA